MELIERKDVWTYLKETDRPIVLYGTGNGADKIFSVFDKYGITVSDMFMSDDFYREDVIFHGFKLKRFAEILELYENPIIVLAFAAFRRDLLGKIKGIAKKYEVLAPEVPVFGDDYFSIETIEKYSKEIEKTYSLLADDLSRKVFKNSLEYRISGKIDYLFSCETERDEVFENIIKLSDSEVYVDLGAYRGDTVEEFLLMTHGKYEHIYALEPDIKNYNKLIENMGTLSNAEFINKASFSDKRVVRFEGGGGRNSNIADDGELFVHTTDVDSVLSGRAATYIKMDVEGAEAETLEGLKNTLANCKPKLAVSAYHRTADLFTLPILISSLNPDYKIYLRHHPYIPDWETNIYCI